MIIIMIITLYL